LQVNALARPAVHVMEDQSVSEALRMRDLSHAAAIVTTDQRGQPRGVVNDAAVDALPENRRAWVPASTVTRALIPEASIAAGLVGEDLLSAMNERPAPEYLVTRADGTVVGVLVRTDVDRAINGEFSSR
jgi:predicted transcriptional regulator